MILNRFRISGHCRFQEPTEFTFSPGLNEFFGEEALELLAAIRWTLGERRLTERFAQQERVLETSLFLNNTESVFPLQTTEISLTRRLVEPANRQEYDVNKVEGRLKDITNLIQDILYIHSAVFFSTHMGLDVLRTYPAERRRFWDASTGCLSAVRSTSEQTAALQKLNERIEQTEFYIHDLRERLSMLHSGSFTRGMDEILRLRLMQMERKLLELEKSARHKMVGIHQKQAGLASAFPIQFERFQQFVAAESKLVLRKTIDLYMTAPQDPLNSGISIKKLSSLTAGEQEILAWIVWIGIMKASDRKVACLQIDQLKDRYIVERLNDLAKDMQLLVFYESKVD